MKNILTNKPLLIIVIFIGIILAVLVINYLIIRLNGTAVPVPTIPREVEKYGKGQPLKYIVMGDSTTVSQGGEYDKGYARETARYLASQGYAVSLKNIGVSGARIADVRHNQLPQALEEKPDIVLIAAGANDVTHITSIATIRENLVATISALKHENEDMKILLTGSPQMGSIPRFPQPSRLIAKIRTDQINTMIRKIVTDENVIFVPIAEKTGPIFAAHPELYAADNFHPTTEGYSLWTPVIVDALRKAINK